MHFEPQLSSCMHAAAVNGLSLASPVKLIILPMLFSTCNPLQTALTLYYTHVGGGKVGEPWDSWSWLQAVGFGIFAAGAFLYNKGHKQQEDEDVAAGKTPQYSKWAVLKSTLGIYTGHHMATRRFRLAGNVVLAGVRLGNGLGRVSEESEE